MPNPYDHPDLYESIVLAGVSSPGKVKLSGHDRAVNWDIKNGSAQQGASMSIKDIPPIAFTATFELMIDVGQGINEIEEWDAFQLVIDGTISGATPKAVDIYHPDLERNGIRSVCKGKVGGMVIDPEDPGKATVTVTFQEYVPPKPKGGSPKGSSSKKPDPKKPDPNQAALDELARLTEEYRVTPWGMAA